MNCVKASISIETTLCPPARNQKLISAPGFFEDLGSKTDTLVAGILDQAREHRVAMTANRLGGMFGLFFSDQPVMSFAQATACNLERFRAFFHGMLDHGIYLAPSAYEAGFVSAAHSDKDIKQTIETAGKVLATL